MKFHIQREITTLIIALAIVQIDSEIQIKQPDNHLNNEAIDDADIQVLVFEKKYINDYEAVQPNEFPFNVYIVKRLSSCSGSLIAKNLVLTAAHCVQK
jgi:V8-like Glu-specific endopeptidase